MKIRRESFVATMVALAVMALISGAILSKAVHADSNAALLAGTVESTSGAKMEGVTVSAKLEGRTITASVFTDEHGDYYFPPMDAGNYQVWAQADTFETARASVELTATRHQDFSLKPMKDFERQLTGDQILASLPENTPEDRRLKRVFRNNCTGCHQPNYILQNRFDADGWMAIMNAMRDLAITGVYNGEDAPAEPMIEYFKKDLANYLAKVRGPGPTAMKFKVRARPTGDAARVVFTEYDVPLDPGDSHETEYMTNNGSDWSLGTPSTLNGAHGIHDAQADSNGNIWFSNSVASKVISLGRIDGKTGEVRYITVKAPHGNAAVGHAIIRDAQGMLWFNLNGTQANGQGSLVKLDPTTEKLEMFTMPKSMNGTSVDFDGKGKIWVTANPGALRFDPDTRQFTEFKSMTYNTPEGEGRSYGVAGDSLGNGWWSEFAIDIVGHSDIETGKSLEVRVPPVSGQKQLYTPEQLRLFSMSGSEYHNALPWAAGPRRMSADKAGDYVWVCDFWGGSLAKIDIRTQKLTLVPLPSPDTQQPYQSAVDSNHNVWANLMNGDEIMKFDLKTSQWTAYPLPTLGAETRHFSILDRDGAMQVILPYSRARKVARMTFRTQEEMQSLKSQAQQREQANAQ